MPMNQANIYNQQQLLQQQQFLQQQYQQQQMRNMQGIGGGGIPINNNNQMQQQQQLSQQPQQHIEDEKTTPQITDMDMMNPPHDNKYEWLETKDLWRGGRCSINGNTAIVNGSVCVVANIEISKRSEAFYWDIYVEKISNRCWIGILPGPISSINWKIGECPPRDGIGIENTYGFIYNGTSKSQSIGRAPKNRDHLRFILDLNQKTLYGSLNDKEVDTVFYKGDDLPKIACICIINSTGKGKFQLRGKQDS